MTLLARFQEQLLLAASWGQAAFIGVFLLVLIGLLFLPSRLLGQAGSPPVWWKSVRLWAAVICSIQIIIYWIWG